MKLRHPLRFELPKVSLTPRLIVILVPTQDLSHITLLELLNALISDERALRALLQASSQREVRQYIDDNAVYQARV
ncbi:PTS sugar transporter subunit IIA [Candidatus Sodalis endolongispinus]|uniref:PTS sugar transporter subunit IIA n=1 Tax=Candidatus Sodalis endolongispinus TaxID=2812662 RepID=A0ABS5YEP3_9GAMM|nr:PTS sugar transporter subunit IIA [Candidatus Sodalis endolongispinus]